MARQARGTTGIERTGRYVTVTTPPLCSSSDSISFTKNESESPESTPAKYEQFVSRRILEQTIKSRGCGIDRRNAWMKPHREKAQSPRVAAKGLEHAGS
jgi:hypothetical protein